MFEIIITTYNRPRRVYELVVQLQQIKYDNIKRIIIVDSSDQYNTEVKQLKKVVYIHSSHKNQPYQRYLGYIISSQKFLIYLDDDMELLDYGFVTRLSEILQDESISGVALRFENKHNNTVLSKIPTSKLLTNHSTFRKIKGILTGYPILSEGKYGICGNKGKQPQFGGRTEWISGGAFVARRSCLFRNFNFQLMDIFEEGLGMGEDGIIGYGLSKQGTLIYNNELFFLHNDQQNSIYTNDLTLFSRRTLFSRLYLSLEKGRLDGKNLLFVRLCCYYYMFWRLFGFAVNYCINPSKERKNILKGAFDGWIMALTFRYDTKMTRIRYWENQVQEDGQSI